MAKRATHSKKSTKRSRSSSPVRRTKRSRSHSPARKSKSTRPLTPWNLAMKKAAKQLRAKNPNLKGPALFKQGAVLAHRILGR